MRLLHLSDPHFGTERAVAVTALKALVQAQRPDVLLLTGDITQRARAAQFAAARSFVDSLQVPRVLAIPGNHDIPLFNLAARAFAPLAGFRRAFGEVTEPELETEQLLVLGLDTTRRWRHAAGALSAAQIERVARRVAAAPAGQLRLVLVHQPLAVVRASDAHTVLRGAPTAARRWAEAGVDAVLGGHIHLPYVQMLPGRLAVVQAGTALSHRLRREAGNSVNLIRVDLGRRMQVERWDLDEAAQAFRRVQAEVLGPV